MIDAALVLISYTREKDAYGVEHDRVPVRREVFAQVESVSRNEFFAAGQAGIRPEYRFVVFAAEWQGERECEFNGQRYAIYRTYQPDAYTRHENQSTREGSITRSSYVADADRIELYAGRRVGVNGA